MKVIVEDQACLGLLTCGLCHEYFPLLQTFHNGEYTVPEGLEVLAYDCEESCPTGSIVIED